MPLTKNSSNKIPITVPPGYRAGQYELYRLFFAAGGNSQSAAIAAALAHDQDVAVQDMAFPQLKTLLVSRKQRLTPAANQGTTELTWATPMPRSSR